MSLSSNCEHREDLSDCADSQADLSLRPVQKCHFACFVFMGVALLFYVITISYCPVLVHPSTF